MFGADKFAKVLSIISNARYWLWKVVLINSWLLIFFDFALDNLEIIAWLRCPSVYYNSYPDSGICLASLRLLPTNVCRVGLPATKMPLK